MATHSGAKLSIKAMCINIDEMLPFLRSVGFSIVAQRTTQMVWREDETPGVIRTLAKAKTTVLNALGIAFSPPGTVDIVSASDAEIAKQVAVETHHRVDALMNAAERGPLSVARFLDAQEEIRAANLESLGDLYADASQINREIAAEWGLWIERLARVKLGATLTVKGLGQIPGPGWIVSLGYDIVVGTIDDLADAGEANGIVVTVGRNATTESLKEVAGRSAEQVVDAMNKKSTEHELGHALARMRQLEDKLARQAGRLNSQQRLLANGVTSPAIADSAKSLSGQVARNAAKLDLAQAQVAKSAGKFALAKAVSWVFLAKDVTEAISKYNTTVAAAQ